MRLFVRVNHPFEIMNAMKISSTLLVLLMLSGLIPAFGQSMPKPATDAGGAILDEKAHIDAKTKWIKENPEAYRKAGGDPEAVLRTAEPKAVASPAPTHKSFDALKTYQLVEVVAVASSGSKASPAELKGETASLQKEFLTTPTILQYGLGDRIKLSIGAKSDLRGVQTRKADQLTWEFSDPDCEVCAKRLMLRVVSENAQSMTLDMSSEDENAPFVYRFAFKITNH